jgi:hypothetical protein
MEHNLHPYNQQSKLLKPFERAYYTPVSPADLEAQARNLNVPLDAVIAAHEDTHRYPVFKNGEGPGDYQVQVRWDDINEGVLYWLSIKRLDKGPIHDWRHMQEIKNMIVGPEHEGCELYPAESRLVDTANQYHMFVSRDPKFRFPFGISNTRIVSYEDNVGNTRQRPLS